MRAVTHNLWAGQDPEEQHANVLRLIGDTGAPEVVALQEATFLRSVPGYHRIRCAHEGATRQARPILLVRREEVDLLRNDCVHVGGPYWLGPHGRQHAPHTYPHALIRHEGIRWRVLDVHRVPMRLGPNLGAWRAEHQALTDYGRRNPKRAAVLLGDWNAAPADLRPLAANISAAVRVMGIDGALTINAEGNTRKLADTYGSDAHRPVVHNLRKDLDR